MWPLHEIHISLLGERKDHSKVVREPDSDAVDEDDGQGTLGGVARGPMVDGLRVNVVLSPSLVTSRTENHMTEVIDRGNGEVKEEGSLGSEQRIKR